MRDRGESAIGAVLGNSCWVPGHSATVVNFGKFRGYNSCAASPIRRILYALFKSIRKIRCRNPQTGAIGIEKPAYRNVEPACKFSSLLRKWMDKKIHGPSPHLLFLLGKQNGSGGYPIEHILRLATAITR
jgi:hypothetical protein